MKQNDAQNEGDLGKSEMGTGLIAYRHTMKRRSTALS
jgi:hypothetical protein